MATSGSRPTGRTMDAVAGIAAPLALAALAVCDARGADAPAPSGSAAQCYDLRPVPGKKVNKVFTYTHHAADGKVAGRATTTEESVVGAEAEFEGQRATETRTVGTSSQGTTYTGRAYTRPAGAAAFTTFGDVTEARIPAAKGRTIVGVTKSVYAPPLLDASPGLAQGQTLTIDLTLVQTISLDGVAQKPIRSDQTHTARFVGVEPLTIAAGTFKACKFEQFAGGGTSGTPSRHWLLVGHGIELKSIDPGTPGVVGDSVHEVTSLRINGSVPR